MNISFPLSHPKYSALSLSPVVMDDAAEMLIHLNDEEIVKYLIGPPFPMTIDQVKGYISSRPVVNHHSLTLAIRHNGKMIGEVGLVPQKTPQTYELGYYLSRPYWNNGITTTAVKTYLNVMVQQISTGEDIIIVAGYLIDNFASEKVLKKCGFMKMGLVEKVKHGQRVQGVEMVRIFVDKEQRDNLVHP
jgi:ribosomal-protein-alanine N-acetyltransferase